MTLATAFLCVYTSEGDISPDCDTGRCINSATSIVNWEFEGERYYNGIIVTYFPEDEYESEIEHKLYFQRPISFVDGGTIMMLVPPDKGELDEGNVIWKAFPSSYRISWKKFGF